MRTLFPDEDVAQPPAASLESSRTDAPDGPQIGLQWEALLGAPVGVELPDSAGPAAGSPGSASAPQEASAPIRLIRRNLQVVPWNENKIEVAIRKAFLGLEMDSDPAVALAHCVTQRMISMGQAFVHIEDVQDCVQEEIMRSGHFKAAEAYILYRAKRAAQRQAQKEETPEEAVHQDLMVVVRREGGETFFWDGLDLRKRVEFGCIGLNLGLTPQEIEAELRRSVYSEIEEKDLKKTIILNAKALIERDADFAKFAGRVLLTYIYEEVLGWDIRQEDSHQLKSFHQRAFRRYIKRGVQIGRLDKRLLEYDLKVLSHSLDPSADLDFDYLGIQTLYDRYLMVDKTGEVAKCLETPQFFWMRVAMGLFLQEVDQREERVVQLYNLYKSRRFCSSTPTLFNSGTQHSQLSSCYLFYISDSLDSIMTRGISENAFLSKWAGGLGGSWTAVRGTGGHIAGTNGESQGVVPFLKLYNDMLHAVNQGGKRGGAGCAYLETWHNDLFDFLELRRGTGDERRRTHEMNTANWVPDLFMKRMEARQDWTFFRSNEVADLHDLYGKAFEKRYEEYEKKAEAGKIYGLKMPAIQVWKKMLTMLFETGHPWMTWKDPCNVRSPQDHVGVVHSSNLCTEITLNTSETETAVCNLGSIILDTHLDAQGNLDHDKLRETVRIAVRALDNVIDLNFYPTAAARESNLRHRPIGLGVMGLQNALYKKRVPFGSHEAIEFNDTFQEAIAYYAIEASTDLAVERGSYSSYSGSKWDRGLLPQDTLDLLEKERGIPVSTPRSGQMDWTPLRKKIKGQGMRNSNVMAIAPTATISNIMGTTPCIEPMFKNLYVKSNIGGDFIVLNQSLVRDLKARNLWGPDILEQLKYFDGELDDIEAIPQELKDLYATAFNVDPEALLEAAARRQKWIDQAQSVNLFFANPDLKSLSHTYRSAWHKGLKTTYYARTLGASNIEKATVSVKKDIRSSVMQAPSAQQCRIDNGDACEACQ